MCERLAKSAGPYALVLSSPLERAKESAKLIAGRIDEVEAGLLPDLGGAVATQMYGEMTTLQRWAELYEAEAKARDFAHEQLRTWARIASRMKPRETVLAISHGGIIELPVIALAKELGMHLAGLAFGFCEGVRVTYDGGKPTKLEFVRV